MRENPDNVPEYEGQPVFKGDFDDGVEDITLAEAIKMWWFDE